MGDGRFAADVFHDVDLAARRPADFVDVVAEHPERGPDSLSIGNFDAGFEASVGLIEFALRVQARGGVVASHAVGASVGFLERDHFQIAVLDVQVLRTGGVVLQFLVASAFAVDLNLPFSWIGWGAIRLVEFVAPGEGPAGARRRSLSRNWRVDETHSAGLRPTKTIDEDMLRECIVRIPFRDSAGKYSQGSFDCVA